MDPHFAEVDWVDVHERLVLAAFRLFRTVQFATDEPLLESYGAGPEDLAHDVLSAFLDPKNTSVMWNKTKYGNPTTQGVVAMLVTTMKRDFIEKVRAKRRKDQQSLYVPDEKGGGVRLRLDRKDPAESAEAQLARRAHYEPLRKRLDEDFTVQPDDELQLYVMLQFDNDRFIPYKPRDAAQELGIPVERIYLLKQKLERRLMRLFRTELEGSEAIGKRGKAYA
jgi:hypothetical protein